MKQLVSRYRALKSNKTFFILLISGLVLFFVSLFFNHYANQYTAIHSGNSAGDLILDHLPYLNVEVIFLEGMMIFLAFVIFVALYKPHRLPFMLKATALFICIRAFFVILTHLAPPLHQDIFYSESFLEKLIAGSGDDLFFSGHTGYPFLLMLIFWHQKILRTIFLASTLFFGATVLLGHLHYSIDVFSALFITFGVYHLAIWLFKKDFVMLNESL